MLGALRQTRASHVIVALYALAMATLGFAHKPVATIAPSAIELAAYALPDGTLPDLCLTGHDQSNGGAIAAHCDACALSSAPGLVAPVQDFRRVCVPTRVVLRTDEAGQFAPALQRGPTSRGPPASAHLTI